MSCPPEPVLSEAEGCGHRLFMSEMEIPDYNRE